MHFPAARRFLAVLLAVTVAVAAAGLPALAETPGFVSVVEDLPLMPGLTEDEDAAMVFDSATGRIVEAHAAGEVPADAVRAFYADTLPQLGWKPIAEGLYGRGAEHLSLEIVPVSQGAAAVRFALRPGPAR